jgi:hypothetical protein
VNTPDTGRLPASPQKVFRGLSYGEWRTWPQEEQAAIEMLIQAIFETLLSNRPINGGFVDVEIRLCSISLCKVDLNP